MLIYLILILDVEFVYCGPFALFIHSTPFAVDTADFIVSDFWQRFSEIAASGQHLGWYRTAIPMLNQVKLPRCSPAIVNLKDDYLPCLCPPAEHLFHLSLCDL